MCGIFGVLQHRAQDAPDHARLEETARLMRHRGPDGCGIYSQRGVGLVHTRLSLVDLHERSNQPLWDASGRYCLVYNGELYDYANLVRELIDCGVVLRTTSDSEIVLEALIHFGVEPTLARLEGMFALGLFDTWERTLVVARDRFGIKPLYFHDGSNQFLFASQPSAMQPWLTLRPDLLTVSSYLQGFGGPTSGRSFYEHIQPAPPGGVIRVRIGARPQFSQFFRMTELVDSDQAATLAHTRPAQLVDQVEDLLLKSVHSQLQADAPMGGLVSGGVDSSLVMAMAARIRPGLPVFHADVEGPLSECAAAAQLARELKLDFQRVAVRDDHFLDLMPTITEHHGYPFLFHPNAVPFFMVSHLAGDYGVKAVLCGEGSDECYLGYPWLVPNVRATLRRLPRLAFRKVSEAVQRCERWLRGKGPVRHVSRQDRELLFGMQSQFECEIGPVAFDESQLPPETAWPDTSLVANGGLSYGLRTLLHRNDSLGMAASIESRFPFLDSRLVKLSVNLPRRCKVRFSPFVFDWEHPFFRDKWIIREIARRYLPAELSQRKKRGFPTSAFQRLTVSDRFLEDSFVAQWYALSRPRMRYLLSHASHALRLRLLHLEVWGRVCLRGDGHEMVAEQLRQHVSIRSSGSSRSHPIDRNSPRGNGPSHVVPPGNVPRPVAENFDLVEATT